MAISLFCCHCEVFSAEEPGITVSSTTNSNVLVDSIAVRDSVLFIFNQFHRGESSPFVIPHEIYESNDVQLLKSVVMLAVVDGGGVDLPKKDGASCVSVDRREFRDNKANLIVSFKGGPVGDTAVFVTLEKSGTGWLTQSLLKRGALTLTGGSIASTISLEVLISNAESSAVQEAIVYVHQKLLSGKPTSFVVTHATFNLVKSLMSENNLTIFDSEKNPAPPKGEAYSVGIGRREFWEDKARIMVDFDRGPTDGAYLTVTLKRRDNLWQVESVVLNSQA